MSHTLTLEIPDTVDCEHKGKTIAYDLWSRLWEKAVNAGTDPEDTAALADYLIRTVAGRWCALDQDVKARKAGKPATVYVSRNTDADDREKYIEAALKLAPDAKPGEAYTLAQAHAKVKAAPKRKAHVSKAKVTHGVDLPKTKTPKVAQSSLPLKEHKPAETTEHKPVSIRIRSEDAAHVQAKEAKG